MFWSARWHCYFCLVLFCFSVVVPAGACSCVLGFVSSLFCLALAVCSCKKWQTTMYTAVFCATRGKQTNVFVLFVQQVANNDRCLYAVVQKVATNTLGFYRCACVCAKITQNILCIGLCATSSKKTIAFSMCVQQVATTQQVVSMRLCNK